MDLSTLGTAQTPALFGSEGGWQEFTLAGGEWTVLILSVAAALLAIGVGFYLVASVLAADEGTPKMREIAAAIQEGAVGVPQAAVPHHRHDPRAAGRHRVPHVDGDREDRRHARR